MKIIKKIGFNLFLLISLLYLFIVISPQIFKNFYPFGIKTAVVLTGSMEPTLKINDFVVVKYPNEIKVNDIISYKQDNLNQEVMHRVVKITDDIVITKGDANNTEDQPILRDQITGVYIGKIKYLGKSKTIISSKEYKSRIDELYNRKLSYDYSEYTKYYCFLDTCSSREIDLKSYYEFEKNETQELKIVDGYSYADTVFEVVNGELHVKRVGYDDVYNLANIKSLKVAFNVAFGYDVYLLDNSNTLHYTSFSKDYDTNKGIFDKYNDYKNGIVSEKVKNYAIYESCNCITCSFKLDYNK